VWNPLSSNRALNKASTVSFHTPAHANAAIDDRDAFGPDVDSAKFRFRALSVCQSMDALVTVCLSAGVLAINIYYCIYSTVIETFAFYDESVYLIYW